MVDAIIAKGLQLVAVKVVEVMLKKVLDSQWSNQFEDAKEIVQELLSDFSKNRFAEKHFQQTLKMRTLINPDHDVMLSDIYHPMTISTASNDDKLTVKDGFTLTFSGVVNIIGIAGQGKSTILRKLFLEEISKGERVPFFIELRNVPDGDVLAYFKDLLKSFHVTVTDSNVEFLLQSKKVVLLLDGFDEIRQETTIKAFNSIMQLNKSYACPVITTSRPNTQVCQMPGIQNLFVETIDLVDKLHILNLIERQDNESNKTTFRNLCDLLIENTYLEETINNPIMVTLLYHCFPYMDEVPKDITDFYRQLFGVLYARHDKTKGYNDRERESGIETEPARTLFSNICLKSLLTEEYQLDSHKLHQLVTSALNSHGYDKKLAESFTNDLVKITCLLQPDGNDRFVFLHKSVQEFFAACSITTINDDNIKSDIYKHLRISLISSPKFDNLLQFLYYLDKPSFINEITIETFRLSGYEKFANEPYEHVTSLFDKLISDGMLYGESTADDSHVRLLRFSPITSLLKVDFLKVINGEKRDPFSIDDMDEKFENTITVDIHKGDLSAYSYVKSIATPNSKKVLVMGAEENQRESYKFGYKEYLITHGIYDYYKKVFYNTIVDFNENVYKIKLNEAQSMKDAMRESFGFLDKL